MTFTEAVDQIENVIKNRNCSIKEKEALYKAQLLLEKKAEEEHKEKNSKDCVWCIGDYFFHQFKDALYMAVNNEKYKNSYILERRTDENGNVTSKKYKLVNGKVLGVQKM